MDVSAKLYKGNFTNLTGSILASWFLFNPVIITVGVLVAMIALAMFFAALSKAFPEENITILRTVPLLNHKTPPDWGAPPKPKYMILPPVEYDRYYEGDLTIKIVATLEELRAACNNQSPTMLACARHNQTSGSIYMVEDSVMRRTGWNTGLLLRHEIGHCNGWPADHAGQRPLPWPTTLIIPSVPPPAGRPAPRKDETRCCGQ